MSGLEAKILPNIPYITPEERDFIVKFYPPILRSLIVEQFLDLNHEEYYTKTFGWKHSAFNYSKLTASENFENTLFLFIVRNPISWCLSTARNPFHFTEIKSSCSPEIFLNQTISLHVRDEIYGKKLVDSPIDIWNIKNRTYFSAASELKNCLLLVYDHLLLDFDATIQPVSQIFPDAQWTIPKENARKHMVLDRTSYYAYYERAEGRIAQNTLSGDAVSTLRERLDIDLCKALGISLSL